jgi:NAD(P)H-nitrite reductase large subunit
MSPNVHMLDRARASQPEVQKPSQAEVEAAVRTIIRIFHLGNTVVAIDGKSATLRSGSVLEAEFVVVGVGVRPCLGLAEQAGLKIDRGVAVTRSSKPASPESMQRAI